MAEKLTVSSDAPGRSMFLLGNAAIARGAIEAGVQVVAAYPGTPSSEITETLYEAAPDVPGMYVEWSVNEKVAFEVALAGSMCGLRSVAIMKHVGVNVAHDPLMTAAYMGMKGLVIVSADDPGQWSSQNEQDNRILARQAYIPVLEPSSAQEAKEMMKDAFALSEQFEQIFMLRPVTRISHARGDVQLGEINRDMKTGDFMRERRFTCFRDIATGNRVAMIKRMEKIREASDTIRYNQLKLVEGAKLGIVACGISYGYTMEALNWLGLEDKVSILKIGMPYPAPEKLIKQLISSVPEVLVIEELEPFCENNVKIIAQEADINVKVHGKKDVIPLNSELSVRIATEAIAKIYGMALPVDFSVLDGRKSEVAPLLPKRPPTLCAGCPHRAASYALKVVARKVKKDLGEVVHTSDIGCYSLNIFPPLATHDTSICMGGGFGLANGISHDISAPVIAQLGDSTFFHSGMPAMVNAVFNKANMTMVVMDNSTTAMTGFQPHPGAPEDPSTAVKPEDLAKACGIKFVEVVNPFELDKTIEVLEKAVRFDGPAVVVTRALCGILNKRNKRKNGEAIIPYKVDLDVCTDCRLCVNSLGCPAIQIEDDHVSITASACEGCGLCAQVCPTGAIQLDGGN